MKIEEVIKQLESILDHTRSMAASPDADDIWRKDIDALKFALTALRSMSETTKPGWISVKERLPSIRDDGIAECYLISDGNLIHMAYYVTGEWRFCESGQITEPMFYEVTHWMPLPEPPEEG